MFKPFVSLLSGHASYIAATESQILHTQTLTDSSPFPLTAWHWQYALAVLLNINVHQSPFRSVSRFNMHPSFPPTRIMTMGVKKHHMSYQYFSCVLSESRDRDAVLLYMCCISRIWETHTCLDLVPVKLNVHISWEQALPMPINRTLKSKLAWVLFKSNDICAQHWGLRRGRML